MIKITAAALVEPPTNLVATSIVGNTVTLSWTAPTNSITPTGYVLTGGVSPGEALATIATGSTATTFTFVAPTRSFYLRMHSVAGATTSAVSNEIRVFVNLPAPPSAPTNLLGLVNGSILGLAWTNTAGGGTPTGLMIDVTGTVALSLSLLVTGAFSGTIAVQATSIAGAVGPGSYTLSVVATNACGSSAPSSSQRVTIS